ncbi:MAG: hypothetical protein AAGJ46_17510 [Planctomycetota bacterium]
MHVDPSNDDRAREDRALLSTLLVTAAAALCYFFTSYRMGEDAQTVGVIALLSLLVVQPRWTCSPWPWVVVLSSLLWTLVGRPLDVPNHHFMLTYVSAAVALSLGARPALRAETLQRNARWLLVVLMGFATVHKVVSPTFRDGSYLGYEIARGGFGDPVMPLLGSVGQVSAENDRRIVGFRARDPASAESVTLDPPVPFFPEVAVGFAVLILAIEALIFAGFLLAPRHAVSHLLLISFATTLAVLRQEFTFISVISAIGMMACTPQQRGIRLAYGVFSVLCAAAVLKTLG